MSEWKKCKVSDYVSFQNGYAFKSKNFTFKGNYKVIKIKELKDGAVRFFDDTAQINSSEDNELERYKVKKGDVLFALTGDPVSKPNPLSWVGRVSLYTYNEVALLNQRVCKAVFSDDIVPLFFYYYFRQNDVFFELAGKATGSASQANISTKTISDTIICIPDYSTQKRIVSVLSIIDEKIAINNAINENLEQQAQVLFKAWFVDFEPFGGVMPDDWKTGTFSDIIESTLGGDWGKEEPTGNYTERVFCIRGADIPEVKSGNRGKMPTRFILPKNYSSKKLIANDIVVEISGGSPTQSTGRVAAISQSLLDRYDGGMICTNFCRAIKPYEGYSSYIYYYWQYLYDRKVFFSYENGTTGIKNLDLSGFIETEPIIIPTVHAIQQFNITIDSFYSKIFENGYENEQLTALRDTLLPKLMNGEIDVSDVKI